MSKKSLNVAAGIIGAAVVAVATVVAIADQREQKRANAVADRNGVKIRKPSSKYEQFAKRPLDAVLSIGATVALSPVLGTTALLVKKKLGSPVFFFQERPGRIDPVTGKETLGMADWKDVVSNALGGAVGVLILKVSERWFSRD